MKLNYLKTLFSSLIATSLSWAQAQNNLLASCQSIDTSVNCRIVVLDAFPNLLIDSKLPMLVHIDGCKFENPQELIGLTLSFQTKVNSSHYLDYISNITSIYQKPGKRPMKPFCRPS